MKAEVLRVTIGLSVLFDIGIIVTSVLFRPQSYELINEYANVSSIWRGNRVDYCGQCKPPYIENNRFRFRHGPVICYQEQAETQAALLDYNVLLQRSSSDYFQQYKDTYNFNDTRKGETYFQEREGRLRGYPESWLILTAVAISFAVFQIIGLISLGIMDTVLKVEFEKVWIGTFVGCFLVLLAMFVTAIVNKAHYVCPGLKYESKYGRTSSNDNCEKQTWGQSLCGFLGANMFLAFFCSSYLIYVFVKEGKHEKSGNQISLN